MVTLESPTWRQVVPQSAPRGRRIECPESILAPGSELGQCAKVVQTFGQLGGKVVPKKTHKNTTLLITKVTCKQTTKKSNVSIRFFEYSGDSQKSWSSIQGLQSTFTKKSTFLDFVAVVTASAK